MTGTNVHHVNSNNVRLSLSCFAEPKLTVSHSQVGKRDNTAVVVSPVISPDVANDLSISDVLNDGFVSSLTSLGVFCSFTGPASDQVCFTDWACRHWHQRRA